MRHFLLPRPPAAHPGSVHAAATMARLVAPPGLLDRSLPGLLWHSHRRSRSDRGRSNCKRSPAGGNRRTGTDGPIAGRPALCRRHGVDERHRWQDTRPACVPGTVWGTASMQNLQVARGAVLAPKVWQAPAAPSSQGLPATAATVPHLTSPQDRLSHPQLCRRAMPAAG